MPRAEPGVGVAQPGGPGDLPARLLLATTGVLLAVGPPLLVAATGWWAAPALTLVALGVLLVILSAFYPRVHGVVRFGRFELTIDAPNPYPNATDSGPVIGISQAAVRSETPSASASGEPTAHPRVLR